MQAGTTGINTTRVYNPIKQAQDHDPHGVFVRRWLPALRRVPDAWLFALGGLFVAVTVLLPYGLTGLLRRREKTA